MSAKNTVLIAKLTVAFENAEKEAREMVAAFGEEDAKVYIKLAQDARDTLDMAIADNAEMEAAIDMQAKQADAEREMELAVSARIKPVQDKGRKAKRQARFQPAPKPASKPVDPIERLEGVELLLEQRSRRNQAALKAQMMAGPTPVEIMLAKRAAEIQPVVAPKEPMLASELVSEPLTREGRARITDNIRREAQREADAKRWMEREQKMELRKAATPVRFTTETGEKEAPRFENPFERRAREAEEAKKAELARQQQARINAVRTVDAKWAAL